MMETIPSYYPNINIHKDLNGTTFSTNIRKLHSNGKWYSIHLRKKYSYGVHNTLDNLIDFNKDCYYFIILGRVLETSPFIDSLQVSEEERLRKLYLE